jgi:predicted Fe-S protein YdhL (DUF1289 family)
MSVTWTRLAARAAQVLAQDEPHLPSPCQSVCVMHPRTGWCEGCMRTLQEIADWSRLDDEARRQVWRSLTPRLAQRTNLET